MPSKSIGGSGNRAERAVLAGSDKLLACVASVVAGVYIVLGRACGNKLSSTSESLGRAEILVLGVCGRIEKRGVRRGVEVAIDASL